MTMQQHLRRCRDDDSGAVAVITAITLTVLVLMAAFVLDLAGLRADRVQSKAAADMAAIAAAVTYDPEAVGSARAACLDAIAFVEANLRDFGPAVGAPDCTVFPAGAACSESTPPATAVYTSGPYTVRITSPVPYGPLSDGYDLMEGLVHDAAHDGVACDRIGVRISRDRNYLLAPVAGFTDGTTTQSSVARWRPGGDEELYASLVILRRQGCATLRNSGNNLGRLIVGSATVTIDGEQVELPGTITVDTVPSSSCNGGGNWSSRVIAVQNNGQALIRADGRIFSFGLESGAEAARVYWDTVVTSDPNATSGLHPRPTAGPSITREPVDHRFNCLSSYPNNRSWSPSWTGSVGLPIAPCTPDDPPPPYLQNLWNGLNSGTLAAADAAASAEWSVFPTDVAGASCTGSGAAGTYGPGTAYPSTKWYIDCPSSTGQAFAPEGLTFQDVEYVVSRNRIELGGGEGNHLTIEGADDRGAVLFLQNGRLYKTGQARMYLLDTFVYLDNGHLEFGGNNPSNAGLNHPGCSSTTQAYGVCWHAPGIDLDACESYMAGLPPAACFTPLALWSNTTTQHDLGGQTTFDISGSFFTPNASPFSLSGQSAQNFTKAQFFTAELEMSGQAPVEMAPNPDTNIPIPLPGTALIR
jgi:Flp pilus assembly protein TadG